MGLGGWTLALGLVALVVPVPAAARAGASSVPSGQGLFCTADWVVHLDQPISMTGSFGQYTSGGETGVIDCHGSLGGHPVTGPGTYGESGAFGPGRTGGADCINGGGAGDYTATIPTAAGPQHVSGMVSFYWTGPVGVVFDGRFLSAFRLSPEAGDCVNQPARALRFQAAGLLSADGGA